MNNSQSKTGLMVYPPIALMKRGLEALYYIFLCIFFWGGELNNFEDILEEATTVMSAARTSDEERTLKITLELFMKNDFTCVTSVGRTHEKEVALKITWVLFIKDVANKCDKCEKDLGD